MRIRFRALGLVMLLLGSAAIASAQASDKAIAAALESSMTPGEGQKKLGFMVGTFDVKFRTWPSASSPAVEDTGVMVGNWVIDGRYVQLMLAGTVAGEPYKGIGYAGFDNTTKKYVPTFMDSGSTGMEWYTGEFDASGKKATLKASVANPVTGKPTPLELRLTIDAVGNHVTEALGRGAGEHDVQDDGVHVHEAAAVAVGNRRSKMTTKLTHHFGTRILVGTVILLLCASQGFAILGVWRRHARRGRSWAPRPWRPARARRRPSRRPRPSSRRRPRPRRLSLRPDAAAASAAAAQAAAQVCGASPKDAAAAVAGARVLYKQGLITESENNAAKGKILAQLTQ